MCVIVFFASCHSVIGLVLVKNIRKEYMLWCFCYCRCHVVHPDWRHGSSFLVIHCFSFCEGKAKIAFDDT